MYDPTNPQRSSHQGWSSEASLPLGGYINPSSNGSGPVELEDNETFGSIIKPAIGDNVQEHIQWAVPESRPPVNFDSIINQYSGQQQGLMNLNQRIILIL